MIFKPNTSPNSFVTSALQSAKQEKKAAPVNRTLRLDVMGREIDEQGNVIKYSA